MKKVDFIFVASNLNQKPFHKLKYLNDSYIKIILPFYLKNNLNLEKRENLIFKNDRLIKKSRLKKNNFFEIYNFIFFHLSQFFFVIKFIKTNKLKISENPKILTHGFKNFFVSCLIKFYIKEAVLINHPGDEINKEYLYFGSDPFSRIFNLIFIKFQIFLKKITIKKSWIVYMEKGLYNYDKKEYKLPIKKKVFLPACIETRKFQKFKKKKFNNNIVCFGNIQNDGHIETLSKIIFLLKKKYNKTFNIHIIGHDPENVIKKISNPNLIYHGYLKNFSDVESIFKKCSFGSALYDFGVNKKKIILSAKINEYFSHSIPVIASNNSYEKKIINKKKLGYCSNSIVKICNFINSCSINKKKYFKIINNLENYSILCDEKKNLTNFYKKLKKIIN